MQERPREFVTNVHLERPFSGRWDLGRAWSSALISVQMVKAVVADLYIKGLLCASHCFKLMYP